MKKILVLLFLFMAVWGHAQSGISYQAVLMSPTAGQLPGADNPKSPLVNASICLRFSISASIGGIPEYQEIITASTDGFGMVNVVIGAVNPSGFAAISWVTGTKYLKVELDHTGSCNGSNTFSGVSEQPFTTVPFALYALNSGSGGGGGPTTTTLTGDVNGTGTTGSITTTITNNAITTDKIANSSVTNSKLQNSSITINGNPVALGGTATINASPIGTVLTSGNVLVGNTSNEVAEVTMNGDVSINNLGVTTITNNAVTTDKIANSNVTNAKLQNSSITINGYPVALGGTATINASPIGTALTSGNVLVGNTSNEVAEVTMNGDVSINNLGVTTITNNAVTTDKIANSNVTNAKLQNSSITINGYPVALGGTATINASPIGTALISGNVLVGNTSNEVAEVTMNGDVTISNSGATTIASNAVTSAKIKDGEIVVDDLHNDAVEEVKIKNDAVTNTKIANNAVTTAKILDGTIKNEDISNTAAIQTSKIKGFYTGNYKIPTGTTGGGSIYLNVSDLIPSINKVYETSTIIFQSNNEGIQVRFSMPYDSLGSGNYDQILVGFAPNFVAEQNYSFIIIL